MIGDAAMFTSVLAHLSTETHDVESKVGKHSCFIGQVQTSYIEGQAPRDKYIVIDHPWDECHDAWEDSPGTKACKCLRDKFHISPKWDLLKYKINISPEAEQRVNDYIKTLPHIPFVLIHYEGNTSSDYKNIDKGTILNLCEWLIANNITPVILDWDNRCNFINNELIFCPDANNPIWMNTGTGDAETLAALIKKSLLLIGIDSGPLHVAGATETPAIGLWVKHSPYNYLDNCPNIINLVPTNWQDYLRGNKETAKKFFEEHYNFDIYDNLLEKIKIHTARILNIPLDIEIKPVIPPDSKYYDQKKAGGLDYLAYGGWQDDYGDWLAETIGLSNKTVLDAGCACGTLAEAMRKRGATVYACDKNEYMVNQGARKFPNVNFLCCNIGNLVYENGQFDMVHLMEVFQEIDNPHVCINELMRVLKPGGLLVSFWSGGMEPAYWHELVMTPDDESTLFELKLNHKSYLRKYPNWSYFIVKAS